MISLEFKMMYYIFQVTSKLQCNVTNGPLLLVIKIHTPSMDVVCKSNPINYVLALSKCKYNEFCITWFSKYFLIAFEFHCLSTFN
jgi:hypothetical protein